MAAYRNCHYYLVISK